MKKRPQFVPFPGPILLFLWILSSCSILEPGDPEEVRITNRTASAIHIQVWELETSYTVDPAPSFALDPSVNPILLSGESLTLSPEEIDGPYEPGMDLAVFVFEVQGSTAYFRTVQQVLAREIRNRNGRISIRDF